MAFFNGLKLTHVAVTAAALMIPVFAQGCSNSDDDSGLGGVVGGAACDSLSGTSQDVITVQAYAKAASDLSARADKVQADWLAICNSLNTSVGQPTASDAKTSCGTLNTYIKAQAGLSIAVSVQGGCHATASVEGTCDAKCTANAGCDITASCTGGEVVVDCNGSCSGSCTISDPSVACSGTCTGDCDGMCDGTATTGTCKGTCTGTCHGSCEVSPGSATCDGQCQGTCSANASPPYCTGTVSCGAAATCTASCHGSAEATIDCSNPSITAVITGDAALNTGFQANLEAIGTAINETTALAPVIADLAGQTSGALSAISNVGTDAAACFATTITAFASVGVSINVSVSASATVSGSS
jgi:hypothetical protein